MKGYLFLANGFEETEAISPLDLLRRAGADVKTVGIGGKKVVGSHDIEVVADLDEKEISNFDVDFIILPGGMPGTLNLDASDTVRRAIETAQKRGAYICAICAAPAILLGKRGLLAGKKATCYPGMESYFISADAKTDKVVVDGNFITSRGLGTAVEFGLAIVGALYGDKKAAELRASVVA
ncbi:MAG: DJ-1/PfpI family protein [Clostridia bacterium]|nr:DJ-1/PfpI family protein [Clostridia bacterium]